MIAVKFEVFTTVKIQVEIFWVVTRCGHVVEYKLIGRPCCLEDESNKVLRNVGTLPQHYTASQPRRPRLTETVPRPTHCSQTSRPTEQNSPIAKIPLSSTQSYISELSTINIIQNH
jgi:hypothetical protein